MKDRPATVAIRLSEKPELTVMRDAALNAETPVHLLDEPLTPIRRFFVRNNGRVPTLDEAARAAWTLEVDGEVDRPLRLTLDVLKGRFAVVSVAAVLECAGNGRRNFVPETDGIPWDEGAVGCARWTGVRLADILAAAGLRESAVYTGHFSPDLQPDSDKPALSRGLPIAKALAPETLVAFEMNGEPLPLLHGAPLRLVAPGFPGSAWQKWLNRIWVRDREHDGPKMTGFDYRLPVRPVQPGEKPDPSEMRPIEDMPVKSLIYHPADGATVHVGNPVRIAGFAWSGHIPVKKVELSQDGGVTWNEAALAPAAERFAWREFHREWTPQSGGTATLMARATDENGRMQPRDEVPWNPKGYCNNLCQRVQVRVEDGG